MFSKIGASKKEKAEILSLMDSWELLTKKGVEDIRRKLSSTEERFCFRCHRFSYREEFYGESSPSSKLSWCSECRTIPLQSKTSPLVGKWGDINLRVRRERIRQLQRKVEHRARTYHGNFDIPLDSKFVCGLTTRANKTKVVPIKKDRFLSYHQTPDGVITILSDTSSIFAEFDNIKPGFPSPTAEVIASLITSGKIKIFKKNGAIISVDSSSLSY